MLQDCHFGRVGKSKAKIPQTGFIILEPNVQAGIVGIEQSDFVKEVIYPKGRKKEFTISILRVTGAQIDAIPDDLYRSKFSEVKLSPRGSNAVRATDRPISGLGTFKAKFCWPVGNN